MAGKEALPKKLSCVHPEFRTPHTALIAQWGVMSLLTILRQVESFVYISNVLFLTAYLLSFMALIPLKKKLTPLPIISSLICAFLISQLGLQKILQGFFVIFLGQIIKVSR